MRVQQELVITADRPDPGEVDLPLRRGGAQKIIEGRNMTMADLLLLPLRKGGQKMMKQPKARGRMESAKGGNLQAHPRRIPDHQPGKKAFDLLLPIIILLRRHLGKRRQSRLNLRVQSGKGGEELMANAIAGIDQVVITCIRDELRSDLGEVGQKFCLTVGKKGAKKEPAPPAHRRQTVQTATAAKMMKKRLRLITTVMTERNRRTTEASRLFVQKRVTRHPSRLLNADPFLRRQSRDIDPFADQRNLQLRAEGPDKVYIVAALRTDRVVKMGGGEGEVQNRGSRMEEMEERHRVAAAGEGNKDPFLRADQSVSVEALEKVVGKP